MSKDVLIENMVKSTGMTKKDAESALKAVLGGLTDTLASGQEVSLIGFGKFSVKRSEERMGRNPSTGAEMKIAAKNQVRFAPGAQLKSAVNSQI